MNSSKRLIILVCYFLVSVPILKAQLISTHDPLFMPATPKPAVGILYTDPVFNTAVHRITNAVNSGNLGIVPQYSKRQAWNANDSLMILLNGDQGYFSLYNGQTYQFIRALDDPAIGGEDVFWHPLQKNTIIFAGDSILYSYDVATNSTTPLHVFNQYSWINTRGEGNLSNDGRYYAFLGQVYNYSTGDVTFKDIVVYDLVVDQVISIMPLPQAELWDFDWVSVSPLGNYVAIDYADTETGRYHGVEVYDRNLNFLWQLPLGAGHSDCGLDATGDEILVMAVYDADSNLNRINKYRLSDGNMTKLLTLSLYFDMHISFRDVDLPGWCIISAFDFVDRLTDDSLSWLPFEDEVFALNTDGTRDVRRIAHHHSRRFSPVTPDPDNSVYWAEPHATVNKAGTKVLWGSNWRENMDQVTGVDTYLCEFSISDDVPVNRSVQNVSVLNGQTNCYNATHTITVAGAGTFFTIHDGGSATMIAGQNILFNPGTTVQSGGNLWGYITPNSQYCGTKAPSIPVATAGEENPIMIEEKASFKIYPNPTSGNFILELTGENSSGNVTLDVYGMWGEKVLSAILNGERKQEFSLSARPTGVYCVRIISGDKSETSKIIKQ